MLFDVGPLLEDLDLDVEEYSPILQYQTNGHLKYEFVTAYNQKWLPRDSKKTADPRAFKGKF